MLSDHQFLCAEKIITHFLRNNKKTKVFAIDNTGIISIRESIYFYMYVNREFINRLHFAIFEQDTIPYRNLYGCFRPSEMRDDVLVFYTFDAKLKRMKYQCPINFGRYSIVRSWRFGEKFFMTLTKEIVKW